MLKYLTRFSTYTLLVALAISAVAEFYSIAGLTAIFSASVIPTIIMGVVLGLGKLTATVWLKLNWERAPLTYKLYLIPAIAVLMFLTSMGIFGFLSKAHSDQSLVSGDVGAKIAVYDEKIKTAKDNIEANRKALKQMDEAVDQVMGRSNDEKGADKAVALRRAQQKERARLQSEIAAEQKIISTVSEERAPIAAEVRKVEAEVGPLKYIAALIYGDNPDSNLLEAAVRWVIIVIVAVFDPLALMLLLAAQQSFRWERAQDKAAKEAAELEQGTEQGVDDFFKSTRETAQQLDAERLEEANRLAREATESQEIVEPLYEQDDGPLTRKQLEQIKQSVAEDDGDCIKCGTKLYNAPGIGPFCPNKECGVIQEVAEDITEEVEVVISEPVVQQEPVVEVQVEPIVEPIVEPTVDSAETADATEITTDGVTKRSQMFHPAEGYVNYDGKNMSIEALRGARPDLILNPNLPEFEILYGNKFPAFARTGDIYTRVDVMPHRTYKFNGDKWINLDKNQNSVYLQNISYLQFLISKLESGEYDPEALTDVEQEEIASHLEKLNKIK